MSEFIKYVSPAVDFGEAPAVDMFSRTWEKRAGMAIYMPPAIEEFMKTAKPVKGHRLLLVHGLGSEEAWGFNRNGDGFPEHMEVDGVKEATLINGDDGKNWGFHTFVKNAHTFRDHKNSDPKYTIGGKVVLAAWNPEMRRVELVIPVSEKLAPDVVEAIDRNEKIAVSMGARVPYDVCSICGHKAKHRGEYCKHARDEMNRVYSDGRKVGVHNPRPNFFDISVLGHAGQGRPADPSAYSLAKVASAQAATDWPDRPKLVKVGYVREDLRDKKADIEKEVPSEGEEITPEILKKMKLLAELNAKTAAPLPAHIVRYLQGQDPEKVAATLAIAGITLRPDEFSQIFSKVASVDFSKVSTAIFRKIEPYMAERSDWLSYFGDRMYRQVKLGAAEPVGRGDNLYSEYLEKMKNAVTQPSMLGGMVAAVAEHPYVKSAIVRHELHELEKTGAKEKGLSAGNLVAAMLGPMVLSAYFRSQQMTDPWSVGPVKSLVAEHPLLTGAATALLWHKIKGGKVPLMS